MLFPSTKVLRNTALLSVFMFSAFCDQETAFVQHSEISYSKEECYCPCPDSTEIRPTLEVKGGYFFFADSKLRKIYNEGGVDVQVSGSFPIWEWLQGYVSVEYLERHGRSLHGHQKTSIWEIPVSVGLKPVFKICPEVEYYITIGPRYFYVHQHNHSSFVDRHLSHNGVGGFVNTGFNFFPMEHFLVDVFGEYSYERAHFHAHKTHVYGRSIQVGGFVFGVGLGYAF